MEYNHTQKSPLGLILAAIGLVIVASATFTFETTPILIASGVGFIIIFCSLCFASLTVRDDYQCLNVSFGPVPLFGTKIFYDSITHVQADRSTLLDGWGIHYSFTRGTIYNLWGFDCVRIEMDRKVVRIGTDDPAGLVQFLETKTASNAISHP